jgi:hypothetical protein
MEKVREILAVNKEKLQRLHMERFNLKKLKLELQLEGKEQYHVEVSNKFAYLEDLNKEVEIGSAWEMI